jgi:hypothetical protein
LKQYKSFISQREYIENIYWSWICTKPYFSTYIFTKWLDFEILQCYIDGLKSRTHEICASKFLSTKPYKYFLLIKVYINSNPQFQLLYLKRKSWIEIVGMVMETWIRWLNAYDLVRSKKMDLLSVTQNRPMNLIVCFKISSSTMNSELKKQMHLTKCMFLDIHIYYTLVHTTYYTLPH